MVISMQDQEVPVATRGRFDPLDPRFSFSSIEESNKCLRSWFEKYIIGGQDVPGVAANIGSFDHDVLERLYNLDPDYRTIEQLRNLAQDNWPEFYSQVTKDFAEAGLDLPSEVELKRMAWDGMADIFMFEDPPEVEVIYNELSFVVDIGGYTFRGFIDRVEMIDGLVVITDYKTGKMSDDKYLIPKLNQLLLYCIAYEQVAKDHGLPLGMPAYARLMFTKFGLVQIEVTPEVIAEAEKYFIRKAKRIMSQFDKDPRVAFPPKVGPLCAYCPFIEICPEGIAEFHRRNDVFKVKPEAPAFAMLNVEPKKRDLEFYDHY